MRCRHPLPCSFPSAASWAALRYLFSDPDYSEKYRIASSSRKYLQLQFLYKKFCQFLLSQSPHDHGCTRVNSGSESDPVFWIGCGLKVMPIRSEPYIVLLSLVSLPAQSEDLKSWEKVRLCHNIEQNLVGLMVHFSQMLRVIVRGTLDDVVVCTLIDHLIHKTYWQHGCINSMQPIFSASWHTHFETAGRRIPRDWLMDHLDFKKKCRPCHLQIYTKSHTPFIPINCTYVVIQLGFKIQSTETKYLQHKSI